MYIHGVQRQMGFLQGGLEEYQYIEANETNPWEYPDLVSAVVTFVWCQWRRTSSLIRLAVWVDAMPYILEYCQFPNAMSEEEFHSIGSEDQEYVVDCLPEFDKEASIDDSTDQLDLWRIPLRMAQQLRLW